MTPKEPDIDDVPRLRLGAAAKQLGVSPDTLRRWADAGRIHARLTPGGQRTVSQADVTRMAANPPWMTLVAHALLTRARGARGPGVGLGTLGGKVPQPLAAAPGYARRARAPGGAMGAVLGAFAQTP